MSSRLTSVDVIRNNATREAQWNKSHRKAGEPELSKAELAQKPGSKPSKYRNKRVQTPHGVFSSVREWRRYGELLLMEKAGAISLLERQHRFPIEINGVKICTYVSDFDYKDKDGWLVVEDVKPNFKTEASRKRYQATAPYRMFLLKKRLMLALNGIDVKEV